MDRFMSTMTDATRLFSPSQNSAHLREAERMLTELQQQRDGLPRDSEDYLLLELICRAMSRLVDRLRRERQLAEDNGNTVE